MFLNYDVFASAARTPRSISSVLRARYKRRVEGTPHSALISFRRFEALGRVILVPVLVWRQS